MKSEKTILQLTAFENSGAIYIEKNKEKENKLCVAITSITKKQSPKIREQYEDDLDNARLDCCATGANGVILRDGNRNYEYTVEGLKKLKPLVKGIGAKKYTVHQRIPEDITELIGQLTEQEKTAFSGFVIPEIAEVLDNE